MNNTENPTVGTGNGIVNWIEMDPGLFDRILHRKTYAVCDFILPDGSYLLDRYFGLNEVHVSYQKQELRHPNYLNCVTYFIRFARKDASKVQKALTDMYRRVDLFDRRGDYKQYVAFVMRDLNGMAKKNG